MEIKSPKYNKLWEALKGVIPDTAKKIHLEVKYLEDESFENGYSVGWGESEKYHDLYERLGELNSMEIDEYIRLSNRLAKISKLSDNK